VLFGWFLASCNQGSEAPAEEPKTQPDAQIETRTESPIEVVDPIKVDSLLIYEFMSAVIDTLMEEQGVLAVLPRKARVMLSDMSDTLVFSKADYNFMQGQIKELDAILWSKERFEDKIVLSMPELESFFKADLELGWDAFRQSYDHCIYSITPPLFSRSGMNAFLYCDASCGLLSSRGVYYLFEKRNGEWVLKKKSIIKIS